MATARCLRALLVAVVLGLALPVAGCTSTPEPTSPDAVPSTFPVSSEAPSTAPGGPSVPGSAAPGSPAASPPPAASPATSPARPVADPVSVRRTGGLAGVTQEITVDSDGRWRVRGPGTTAEQTGRLGAAQLTRLHLLLGDPSFGSAFYPGSCRDGFHYSLSSGARRVEWDDCGRPNPAEVAREIVALLVDATPF